MLQDTTYILLTLRKIKKKQKLKMETKKWTDVKRFDSEMIFGLGWGEITSYGHPTGKNLFKVNNRSTRTRCGICSKLTKKTPERPWRLSGIFIVNFEHSLHLILVFLFLTLNR